MRQKEVRLGNETRLELIVYTTYYEVLRPKLFHQAKKTRLLSLPR